MVVLRKTPSATADFGGTKLSLLLEKQHNRGQDGAGAAILSANPEPGVEPYWIAKSASQTPLADVLGMIGKREKTSERIFLGHLRYATFGKNEVAFCHPFVHEASELSHTLLLAGNFNLTNAHELFEDYRHHGSFPTSKADGYLITELIAHELGRGERPARPRATGIFTPLASALSSALANADGAWTLCGMTGDGWAFATRDPHGIRPGFYYMNDDVVVVASERPAIQAAFDVAPEDVKELPPGEALIVSPEGEVEFCQCENVANTNSQCQLETGNIGNNGNITPRPCVFERIYFSRANDADIHRERKALGAALVPQILKAADAPMEDIFFSYIPNSARIAFHGLLEELFRRCFLTQSGRVAEYAESDLNWGCASACKNLVNPVNPVQNASATLRLCVNDIPRFGEVAVKDAKFRTFIADAAARREFYKHVYDVTYGLVRKDDTLVVLDDSIVRGNTMKNAILPMLDRLGPKRIVIASSAPPIRYPDCYGIDMSTLGELVAFKALVNLLGADAEKELRNNPLAALYARFTEEEHCAEIARLLTPPGMKAEVRVVYQTVDNLRRCMGVRTDDKRQPTGADVNSQLPTHNSQLPIGDWYFTGDYPTPGGYKVLRKAVENYLNKNTERSY